MFDSFGRMAKMQIEFAWWKVLLDLLAWPMRSLAFEQFRADFASVVGRNVQMEKYSFVLKLIFFWTCKILSIGHRWWPMANRRTQFECGFAWICKLSSPLGWAWEDVRRTTKVISSQKRAGENIHWILTFFYTLELESTFVEFDRMSRPSPYNSSS